MYATSTADRSRKDIKSKSPKITIVSNKDLKKANRKGNDLVEDLVEDTWDLEQSHQKDLPHAGQKYLKKMTQQSLSFYVK